jgi:hypothetical protein
MKTVVEKKFKSRSEWCNQHTLTPEQVKQLIREKIERARAYHEADKKREALIAESR